MSVRNAGVGFNQLLQLLKSPDVIRFAGNDCIKIELAGAAASFGLSLADVSQPALPLCFVMMIVAVMIMVAVWPMFVMLMPGIVVPLGMVVMIVSAARSVFMMLVPRIVMIFGMAVMILMLMAVLMAVFVVIVFAAGMMNVFRSLPG